MKSFTLLTFAPLVLSLAIPSTNTNARSNALDLTSPIQQPLLENKDAYANAESAESAESKRGFGLRINHGTFIPMDRNRSLAQPPNATITYIDALHAEQEPYRRLERYAGALFALVLLLLIPITLMIVEVAECLLRSISVEEFPERGREKERVESLQDREEWVLRRLQREVKIERSRRWWRWSRH
ncbi:uncharacterized protein DSM5745_02882 [Aspergillus mulundensis]|uniref:Uncharacterized protein n=1 Tax=Aspergillus mulundensis TaxID=1810919 RepID=A0A3D8SIT5_9EURO|nr:hypothetical protein DSM5745_02882 [Aspergillus mulundensis]RDW86240.1 hypothetical protein DSM5745_02882 [Aspergillus mulundensis]